MMWSVLDAPLTRLLSRRGTCSTRLLLPNRLFRYGGFGGRGAQVVRGGVHVVGVCAGCGGGRVHKLGSPKPAIGIRQLLGTYSVEWRRDITWAVWSLQLLVDCCFCGAQQSCFTAMCRQVVCQEDRSAIHVEHLVRHRFASFTSLPSIMLVAVPGIQSGSLTWYLSSSVVSFVARWNRACTVHARCLATHNM